MSETTRELLADLMAWHLNKDTHRDLRDLRERVVIMTGREDLIEIQETDVSLHARLIDAVMDYMDAP
jgi:hypothetical protein